MRFSRNARRPIGLRAKMISSAAVVVCLGAMSLASTASAASHSPKGEFAPFAECPLNNLTVTACIHSLSNGGSFTIGTKTVPLVNPVTLQGGARLNTTTFEQEFVAAENGDTLSKTPQPVPGGLLGITAPSWWPQILKDFFNEVVINGGATGVTATVELAKPASAIKLNLLNLLEAKGTALGLPVKIKLSNAFLGSNCYIGSSSSPVQLNFTTGTTSPPPPTTPITGAVGTLAGNEAGTLITVSGGRLVDNSFSAPGANGCGGFLFSWAVDPLVNSILGVPAAAGKNTAILEGKISSAEAAAVKASE
jgi:hypothetical protein